MLVFPIGEMMDDAACLAWLERHLHPEGLRCPRCASTNRRDFRKQQAFPGYRCRDCQRSYTLLTGTAFAKTHQTPATIVLLLRGTTQGVSTAQLADELALSYQQTHTLRQRVQNNMNESAPQRHMEGTHFEADEVYQNAGKKSDAHTDPDDPPRRRANNRPGHGSFENDRPPVYQIISRQTGEVRIWVLDRTDKANTQGMLQTLLPPGATLYSDELSAYAGWPSHFTVCHSKDEWARDDDGDGVREVHCNSCEGARTGLRSFLRTFRGVHKAYLACYLAVYEAIRNAKRITPEIIQRLCFGKPVAH